MFRSFVITELNLQKILTESKFYRYEVKINVMHAENGFLTRILLLYAHNIEFQANNRWLVPGRGSFGPGDGVGPGTLDRERGHG